MMMQGKVALVTDKGKLKIRGKDTCENKNFQI